MPTTLRVPRPIPAAKWRAMSKPQKRVAIAKDALFRAKTGQMKPTSGSWALFGYREDLAEESDVQTILRKGVSCQCCALGGAICGLAAMEDSIELQRGLSQGDDMFADIYHKTGEVSTLRRLDDLFGAPQVRLLERCFEGFRADLDPGQYNAERIWEVLLPLEARGPADSFYYAYPAADTRLRLLWEAVAASEDGLITVDTIRALTAAAQPSQPTLS